MHVTTIIVKKLAHHIVAVVVVVVLNRWFSSYGDICRAQLVFHKVLLRLMKFKLPRLSRNIIENIAVIYVLVIKSLHRVYLLSSIKRCVIKSDWWVLELRRGERKETLFWTPIVTDWGVIERNFTKGSVRCHFDKLPWRNWTPISIIASLAAN